MLTELRLRTRVAETAVAALAGKCLGDADYDVLLTGPTRVLMPDNRPLAVYLPGHMSAHLTDEAYEVLHSLRDQRSSNRGMASGTKRLRRGNEESGQARRTESVRIPSTVVGALEVTGQQRYCRLTSWTGRNLPAWETLHPLLREVGAALATYVPDRYFNQSEQAQRTEREWVVPGTPFTSLTVNNTYPTGVHTDKGDLDAGFSTIFALRRGAYTGGRLIFPSFRVAVDMADGDLILMDAHQWHGNTPIVCACGKRTNGCCETCGAERISCVAYFRTDMVRCGTAEQERAKAEAQADQRSAAPKIPHKAARAPRAAPRKRASDG